MRGLLSRQKVLYLSPYNEINDRRHINVGSKYDLWKPRKHKMQAKCLQNVNRPTNPKDQNWKEIFTNQTEDDWNEIKTFTIESGWTKTAKIWLLAMAGEFGSFLWNYTYYSFLVFWMVICDHSTVQYLNRLWRGFLHALIYIFFGK